MTRRVEVTLERPDSGRIRIDPEFVRHTEVDSISVEKWSEGVVMRMFEEAEKALTESEFSKHS